MHSLTPIPSSLKRKTKYSMFILDLHNSYIKKSFPPIQNVLLFFPDFSLPRLKLPVILANNNWISFV